MTDTTKTASGKGPRRKHLPGDRFGALVILERLPSVNRSQYVLCLCDCGTEGRYNLSNLLSGVTIRCSNREHHPDPRVNEVPTYGAAHVRLRKALGKASEHTCPCGKPAHHWAYLHGDSGEMRLGTGKDAGRAYSAEPRQYRAMCRACHSRWDAAKKRITAGSTLPSLVHVAFWTARQTRSAAP